jgi:subtilisin family serine protease
VGGRGAAARGAVAAVHLAEVEQFWGVGSQSLGVAVFAAGMGDGDIELGEIIRGVPAAAELAEAVNLKQRQCTCR